MSKNNEFFFGKGPTARPVKLAPELTKESHSLRLEILNRIMLSHIKPTEDFINGDNEIFEDILFRQFSKDFREKFTEQFFHFIKTFVSYLQPTNNLVDISYVLSDDFEKYIFSTFTGMTNEWNAQLEDSYRVLNRDIDLVKLPLSLTTDDVENNLVSEKLLVMAYSILNDKNLDVFSMFELITLSETIDYIGICSYNKKSDDYPRIDLLEKLVNRHELFSNSYENLKFATFSYVDYQLEYGSTQQLLEIIVDFDGGALVIDKNRKDSRFLLEAISIIKPKLSKEVLLKYVGIVFDSKNLHANDDYETREDFTIITEEFNTQLLECEQENQKILLELFKIKSKPNKPPVLEM